MYQPIGVMHVCMLQNHSRSSAKDCIRDSDTWESRMRYESVFTASTFFVWFVWFVVASPLRMPR